MKQNKKKSRRAWIFRDMCVACGCCVKVCPVKAISVYKGLYADVNRELCIGCGKCKNECPASVIEIREDVYE